MEELEERDLDALGDLIDEMFVAKAHPREIMKVLMEHEEQWNDVLLRVLRFARIYQLDFICRCADEQIRVIARHLYPQTMVTDLCVWQVLQSGLPGYIKNLFRRNDATVGSSRHPWHGGMSDRLDEFETYMSSCPQSYRLTPGALTEDFLKTTLWLSRIFQDDVFAEQDAECCKAMLQVACKFPPEIELPFMAQLMERGKPQFKALIWNLMFTRWEDHRHNALGTRRWYSRIGFQTLSGVDFRDVKKYRELFYGCEWIEWRIDEQPCQRWLQKVHFNQRLEELAKCQSYEEFEIKRSLMGVRFSKSLIMRLMGMNTPNPAYRQSRRLLLAGIVERNLAVIEKCVPLEILTIRLLQGLECASEEIAFLQTVERVKPGLIRNFRDAYGGTLLNYLPVAVAPFCNADTFASLGLNLFASDPKIYETLVALGCDPETPLSNGCSVAELLRYLRACHEDCFDFAQAVKL